MTRFAIFGNPVIHSLSPNLWNNAFARLGVDARYIRINPGKVENIPRIIRDLGLQGCNITAPYKETIMPFLDHVDDDARAVGAVNTIKNLDGKLLGFNTDFSGVRWALEQHEFPVKGKKALVLGSGGASKAAVYGLLRAGAGEVVIVNRTLRKAEAVAARWGCRAVELDLPAAANLERELEDAELLINTIPPEHWLLPEAPRRAAPALFDAAYTGSAPQAGEGAYISGLDWLIGQAIYGFKLFFESDPAPYMNLKVLRKMPPKTGVALVGFMGAGKSVVGRCLADISAFSFVDTDLEIEERLGLSVPKIFQELGEPSFRKAEKKVFKEFAPFTRQILSCGGGAILDRETRALLKEHTLVVWLYRGVEESLNSLGKGTRPLLDRRSREPEERLKMARTLFGERLSLYAESSHLLMANGGDGADKTARRIWDEIGKTFTN